MLLNRGSAASSLRPFSLISENGFFLCASLPNFRFERRFRPLDYPPAISRAFQAWMTIGRIPLKLQNADPT